MGGSSCVGVRPSRRVDRQGAPAPRSHGARLKVSRWLRPGSLASRFSTVRDQGSSLMRSLGSSVTLKTVPIRTTQKEAAMSTTVPTDIDIRPFHVEVPDEKLAELRRRIAETRWPDKELVIDPSQGVQLAMLQELARYWSEEYDWRKLEAKLNALPQFVTEIDGLDIHFIHVRSPHADAMPLIITHGWPGSVIEMLEVIGPLTDPTAYGGNAEDAFHVVIPSIPGYGFSEAPKEVGWNPRRIAFA